MRNMSQERTNLRALLFLSFVFGVIYIVGHIGDVTDVMMMYVQINKRTYLNIENFAYCILGIARVAFPIVLIYPHKNVVTRTRMIKSFCYTMAGAYFAANVWILSWIIESIAGGSWSFDVAQYQRVACVMFNHLEWCSRNAETIFYNYVSGFLWFGVAYNFNRDRRVVCKYMIVSLIVRYIVPSLFYYFYRQLNVPEWWLKKMLPVLCSEALLTLALFYAARSREMWKYFICKLKYKAKKKKTESTDEQKQEEKNGL